MAQSQNINYYLGSVKVKHFIDSNNARLSNVGTPIANNDAATKEYVDNNITSSGIQAGTGINISNNIINVSNNLSHVTAIGNINTGSWSANTINVPYGGTGKSSFTPNKLVMGDGTNPLVSLSELSLESNCFKVTCPIKILDSTNAIGLGSGGSFTTLGGASISGKVFIGNDVVISNNTYIQGDITVGNITINGSSNFATISALNTTYTNSTVTNLITTNITSSNIGNINLKTSNITTNNLISTSITNTNLLTSNISSSTLRVTNNISTNNIMSSNISTSTVLSSDISTTNMTTTNILLTNISGFSGILSNLNVLTAISTPSIIASTIESTNINSTNVSVTSITSNNLIVRTSSILANVTTTNLFTNNITATNLQITNISNTNITTSNLNTVSVITNNFTSNNIYTSNITTSNLLVSNITTSNISSNNLISINISGSNLRISGSGIFTTLNSSSISGGQLHINTANINNAIINNNISSSNLATTTLINTHSTISNITSNFITTSNLYVHNISNIATINSNNISTGNLHSSNTAFLNNHIANTSTISNLTVTNISVLGTVNSNTISTASIFIGSNLNVQLINNTTQTTTNLLSTNLRSTNISTSNFRASGTSILGTVNSNNLSTGSLSVTSLSNITSLISSNITVSSILNTNITSSNINITNIATINKKLTIGSNFSAAPNTTSGNILHIAPCIFTDNTTPVSGIVPFWTTNFFGSTILSAQNNITTQKICSVYLQGDPILGSNQSKINSSALTIGYVNNQTGGNMTGQIMLERNDGNWYGSIFTEETTNRIVIANASLSGGGGIGLYTYAGTKISFADISSPTNFTPTTFLDFSNTTSQFYSEVDSISKTSGSVVINGGLGVVKTITCDTISPRIINASIKSLQDVDSTTPITGQSLVWNGSLWSPSTITGGAGSSGPVVIQVYPMELVMPVMGSNGPVPGIDGDYYVTASSENGSTYAAYKCLSDIKNPTDWATDNENTDFWITVQLPSSQNVRYVLLEGRLNNEDPNYITIQGSNNNSTFTDIIVNESFTALNYDGYFAARIPENSISYTYYKFLFANGIGPNPGLNMLRLFKFDNSTYTEGIMDNSPTEGDGKFNSSIINGRWPMAFEIDQSGIVNVRAQFTCYTTSVYVYKKFVMYIDGAPFSNSGSSFIKQIVNRNLHIATQTLEWTGNLNAGIHTLSFFVDGGIGIVFDTNDTIRVNVVKY
jgi:trimeric autotransporter adhesin